MREERQLLFIHQREQLGRLALLTRLVEAEAAISRVDALVNRKRLGRATVARHDHARVSFLVPGRRSLMERLAHGGDKQPTVSVIGKRHLFQMQYNVPGELGVCGTIQLDDRRGIDSEAKRDLHLLQQGSAQRAHHALAASVRVECALVLNIEIEVAWRRLADEFIIGAEALPQPAVPAPEGVASGEQKSPLAVAVHLVRPHTERRRRQRCVGVARSVGVECLEGLLL